MSTWEQHNNGPEARRHAALGKQPSAGGDTLNTTAVDSLRARIADDPDENLTYTRLESLIEQGRFSDALGMLTSESDMNGVVQYHTLCIYGLNHGGDWTHLTPAEKDTLQVYALANGAAGAVCANILVRAGGPDVVIPPVFPDRYRSMVHTSTEQSATPLMNISVYPDPADAEAYLTFPASWIGRELMVIDAQGREVNRRMLNTLGLEQLETKHLANGVYTLKVAGTDGATRMVVKH